MKKVTSGMCLLAIAMFAVAAADAQQSGAGAGASNTQSGQPGQRAAQPQPLPDQTQRAVQNQPYQPGAPRQQGGQLIQPQQRGIDTRQNVITPDNRFGQQRGFNYQGGAPDPMPTPAEREAQGLDSGMQANGQRGQTGTMNEGQRGELGVWLSASSGPGVEIRRVTEGSAAAEIGLQPGDVLMQVNGRPVSSPMEVQRLIRAIPAGDAATLEVWRDGDQQEVSATLQPIRENYRSGYRGDEMPAASGSLESRTMRLEEQLSMVMRELQQLREDMRQHHADSSGEMTSGGIGESARPAQPGPFDQIDSTQPEPFDEAPFEEPAATQPASELEPPAATEATATETETLTTETETSATEPGDDLFGEEPAEPEAEATEPEAETTPAEETETATDTDTETDEDSDSLFE